MVRVTTQETEGKGGLLQVLALMNLPSYCSRIPLSLWHLLGGRPSLILAGYATAAGTDAPAMAQCKLVSCCAALA